MGLSASKFSTSITFTLTGLKSRCDAKCLSWNSWKIPDLSLAMIRGWLLILSYLLLKHLMNDHERISTTGAKDWFTETR